MTRQRPLEGKRILVLEDDFYLASDETALLQQAGATVVGPFGSACAQSTLECIGHLDGAVVDINLGSRPSFAFARMLADRDVPFVFVTGYDKVVIPRELADAPRLEKPIRDDELVDAIARLARTPA